MKTFISFCIIFNVFIFASEEYNSSNIVEPSAIDIYHGVFSAKVHEWGIGIDYIVLDIFGDKNRTIGVSDASLEDYFFEENRSDYRIDENLSVEDLNSTAVSSYDRNESQIIKSKEDNEQDIKKKGSHLIDGLRMEEFFLTKRLLEERDESYVRVSFLENFNSLESEVFRANVKARLYLGRSRKELRLFIEDFNEDSAKNIAKSKDDESPTIGLERRSGKYFGIKSRYSIGLHGFDAFVRARYSYETSFGRWKFQPVQTFTYAIKDEFSELTEFYLDRPTSESTLLRFVVDRGTHSGVNGMDYDGYIQWFYTPRPYAGLSFNLGFNGQTHYENTIINSDPPLIKEENRVFNYLFLVRWRENIWRKWLFYEVGPGVNYHEEHDYRPNYNIYFGIDLFFGHV